MLASRRLFGRNLACYGSVFKSIRTASRLCTCGFGPQTVHRRTSQIGNWPQSVSYFLPPYGADMSCHGKHPAWYEDAPPTLVNIGPARRLGSKAR